ncbi:hypothetical protein ACSBR1_040500 [Camellia fascicularis]
MQVGREMVFLVADELVMRKNLSLGEDLAYYGMLMRMWIETLKLCLESCRVVSLVVN